jgi:GNAT superfamily N-acetyltransferase
VRRPREPQHSRGQTNAPDARAQIARPGTPTLRARATDQTDPACPAGQNARGKTHGVLIRPARLDECELLSELALRSKGCWGYDAELLEACRAELTLVPEDLSRLTVRVAERSDGHVIAFYALGPLDDSAGEVCFFFVDPPFIGTGVGRRLYEDLLATARSAGMRSLRIDVDPGAASFYERMGAARVGETPSNSIPGRLLPSYEVTL